MTLNTKAFLYNTASFVVFFAIFRFAIIKYTHLSGFMISITAFVLVTIVAPKFHAMKTNNGEKLFMKWIFIKGVRIVK